MRIWYYYCVTAKIILDIALASRYLSLIFLLACIHREYDYDDQQVLVLQFKSCHYISDYLHITQYVISFSFTILPDDRSWPWNSCYWTLLYPNQRFLFFHQPQQKQSHKWSLSFRHSPLASLKTCAQHCKRKRSFDRSMRVMRTSMRIVESQVIKPVRSHYIITEHAKMIKRRTKESTSMSTGVKCK